VIAPVGFGGYPYDHRLLSNCATLFSQPTGGVRSFSTRRVRHNQPELHTVACPNRPLLGSGKAKPEWNQYSNDHADVAMVGEEGFPKRTPLPDPPFRHSPHSIPQGKSGTI
jgi:hypothetical protein